MRATIQAILAGFVAVTAAKAGIDFTPTVNRYVSEGAEYSSVSFKDDARGVSITLPRLWTCRGDASRLQLTPPDQNFAEGVIQAAPTKGLLRFDEATVKTFEQQVLGTLPVGSQGATVVSQRENPVIIDGNPSYEFVVAYQTLGQSFQRSVIFVNCPGQQLIFRFSAPKAVFENLNRSFRQSLYSWQWLGPSQTTAVAQSDHPQAAPMLAPPASTN
jgi:hypothetical protein